MAILSKKNKEPATFSFSKENEKQAQQIIAKYPEAFRQSAVMPLLYLAQAQNDGWLPFEVMDYVAEYVGMPYIKVYEIATFYTMYNTEPIGKFEIQVCTTTPCWLRGSDDVMNACQKHLGIGLNETTEDGLFTLKEAECLGACVNAPVMWINQNFYEDLNETTTVQVLETLKSGKQPKPGPQIERLTSAPQGERKTLIN